MLAFKASAIGFGSGTGAGIELFNSFNLVNNSVAKVLNSSFVTKFLCGASGPTHGPDLAMESMVPSTVVLMLAVQGLPSDAGGPLEGISTKVLMACCPGEDPECSLATKRCGSCKCSRLAEPSVNLTLHSDRSLVILSCEAEATDASACKGVMSLGKGTLISTRASF